MSLLDGLIAYYKLDGDAKDELGNYNGTASNLSYVAGKIGQAGSFNGSNGYFYSSVNANVPNEFSVSVWIKTSSSNIDVLGFTNSIPTGGTHEKELYINGSGVVLFRAFDSTEKIVSSNTTINNNQWRHIAVTIKKNDYVKIYIDGIYKNQTAIGVPCNSYSTSYLTVGISSQLKKYFNGLIDEVAIYNKVLSPQEISQLYNNGDGLSYPFSTSSGEIFIGGKRVKDIKLGSRQIKEVYKGDKLIFKI